MNTIVALPIAAAVPVVSPSIASPSEDSIFAAIENHRKAYTAMQSLFSELERVHAIADEKVGPSSIEVPSKIEPGKTVRASCWWDIERAIPSAKHPRLYAKYNRLLEERKSAREAIIKPQVDDGDEAIDKVSELELQALQEFEETTPTTYEGLLAMVIHAGEINDKNVDAFDRDSPIFQNMAAAARTLVRGQS